MENPLTWGKIKRTIRRAIAKHNKDIEGHVIGASLVSYIYNELHKAGFVGEDVPVAEEHKDDVFKKDVEDWTI